MDQVGGLCRMLYAKSKPIETLLEHTNELIKRCQELKDLYPDILAPLHWPLLYTAIQYHDIGKAYSRFQSMIQSKIGGEFPSLCSYDIPHNYISPVFLPMKELQSEYNWSKEEVKILVQMIAYHHDRPKELADLIPEIKEVIAKDLQPRISLIQSELGFPMPDRLGDKLLNKAKKQISMYDDFYFQYVMLKGLLLRIDHAASAHEPIEMHHTYNIGEKVLGYFQDKLRPLQQFTLEHKDRNLIIQAQTGMGKTEAALLWIGEAKAFFTLPLRVSINVLYSRVTNQDKYCFVDEENQPISGLLHSSALDYLVKKQSEEEEQNQRSSEKAYQQAQLLSRKLTFTTMDQILTFPFRFKGHEKWLATLAYSKLVLDEIQAYSPEIMAVLLKALVDITELGGKFLIMSATMPSFFIDHMKDVGLLEEAKVVQATFTDESKRHRVELIEESILEQVNQIALESEQKSVLVICNTIARAVEVYEACSNLGASTHLLHSQFTLRDRGILEDAILKFAPNEPDRVHTPGIWITTQIVEASVDVDFDLLYTEISVLDSLFQRMGRVYRSREYLQEESNVRICTVDCSGIVKRAKSVYDPELVELGLKELQQFNGQILSESTKMKLIHEVYEVKKIKETKYYQTFVKAYKILETQYDLTRTEAQKIIRDIQSVSMIPRELFDKMGHLFESYEEISLQFRKAYKKKDEDKLYQLRLERRQLRREIEQYSVPISYFKVKDSLSSIPHKDFDHLFISELSYDFNKDELKGKGIYIGEPDYFL